ncbi:hypothetical protein D1007_40649 [Hordeum vulgare]|nr:hypothetical protein D1007_40649 [Hordeum vulgare]
MMTFLSIGHHFFDIYLDHDDSLHSNWDGDDVVNNPQAHLPLVLSPPKQKSTGNPPEEDPIPIQLVYPSNIEVKVDDGNQFIFARRTRNNDSHHLDHLQEDIIAKAEQYEEHLDANGAHAQNSGVQREQDRDTSAKRGMKDGDSDDSDFDPTTMFDSDFDISDVGSM